MTETAFYVELPADEYGNTALPTAVIEARLAQDETAGRPKLTILAPAEIAQRWPTRYADFYNGYAETEGPARMLNREEYGALIERIREKGTTVSGDLLRLRNGAEAPVSAVRTTWIAVKHLADSGDMGSVMALYEARELARDPAHPLWPGTDETLRKFSLIDHGGKMHDITRDVILSAVTGAEMDLSVTWPAASRDSGRQESGQ